MRYLTLISTFQATYHSPLHCIGRSGVRHHHVLGNNRGIFEFGLSAHGSLGALLCGFRPGPRKGSDLLVILKVRVVGHLDHYKELKRPNSILTQISDDLRMQAFLWNCLTLLRVTHIQIYH